MDEKITGQLDFFEDAGRFGIVDDDLNVIPLDFGEAFEVLSGDKWIETGLEITSSDKGDLVFKLKNTDFAGTLTGLTVRK